MGDGRINHPHDILVPVRRAMQECKNVKNVKEIEYSTAVQLLYLACEDTGQAWEELVVHHNSVRPRLLAANHIAQGTERGRAQRVLHTQGGRDARGR